MFFRKMRRNMYEKKGKLKKVLAILLIMSVVISGYFFGPEKSDALEAGDIAKVSFDGYLMGTENKYYTMDLNGSVLFYRADGSTYVDKISGKELSKRRHMILTDTSTGEKREGYCVEFDAEIKASAPSYTSGGYLNDTIYFQNLPQDVRKLILAATYYGQNGSNKLPVSGVNSEDYYFATQMLIWEVQQQIRVFERDSSGRITGTKLIDNHGMGKDFFYRYIKGRAAEKCYNYMVENIKKHFVTPDFIGETASQASPIMLKYSMETEAWHGTAADGSNDFDMKWSDSDIEYSKTGKEHRFTSKAPINGEKVIKVKRRTDEGSSAENLLIWNNNVDKNLQVVATGSASPPEFYLRLKTDVPAEVTVVKQDSESGKTIPLEGTAYRIKCVELGKYVSKGMKNAEGDVYATDRDGKVTIEQKLQAGNYLLEEIKAPKGYVVAKEHLKFKVDGTEDKLDVIQKNVPQKGIITINKMGEYKYKESWSDIREKAMGGIDFDIVALADIITPDGTVRAKKGDVVDTVRTDFKGNVSSDKLYLGPYNVVEKDAPVEYRISEPINVALVYSNQDEEVIEKKVNVFNRLKRTTDSIDNSPRTGDESNMNSVLFVMFISLTVMLVVAVASKVRRS